MSEPRRYRFRNTWLIAAAPDAVFDAVIDLGAYPQWWPDVRSVSHVDDDTAELVCRAALPYRLVLRMHRVEQDRAGGRMRVDLSGDLEGFLSGVVRAQGNGTRLDIVQEVIARKTLLRLLGLVARPFFLANHAVMMWRGRKGLRVYLTR